VGGTSVLNQTFAPEGADAGARAAARSTAIVGGGMLGLTLALRLAATP
jgi:NADH dehydrogenase FAD-containing subunit